MPVLFYDFNRPPRKDSGLYGCLPVQETSHWTGQQVIFGCQSDAIMARGVIREIDEHTLGVELIEWLPCRQFTDWSSRVQP